MMMMMMINMQINYELTCLTHMGCLGYDNGIRNLFLNILFLQVPPMYVVNLIHNVYF